MIYVTREFPDGGKIEVTWTEGDAPGMGDVREVLAVLADLAPYGAFAAGGYIPQMTVPMNTVEAEKVREFVSGSIGRKCARLRCEHGQSVHTLGGENGGCSLCADDAKCAGFVIRTLDMTRAE